MISGLGFEMPITRHSPNMTRPESLTSSLYVVDKRSPNRPGCEVSQLLLASFWPAFCFSAPTFQPSYPVTKAPKGYPLYPFMYPLVGNTFPKVPARVHRFPPRSLAQSHSQFPVHLLASAFQGVLCASSSIFMTNSGGDTEFCGVLNHRTSGSPLEWIFFLGKLAR